METVHEYGAAYSVQVDETDLEGFFWLVRKRL